MKKLYEDVDVKQVIKDLEGLQISNPTQFHGYKSVENTGCLHDSCTNCGGTFTTVNKTSCVHGISCPCPKCSIY